MASSSYWYSKYKDAKETSKELDEQINELSTIVCNLRDKLDDEIRDVNKELQELSGSLSESIRRVSGFSGSQMLDGERETLPSSDQQLKSALDALDDEIDSLKRKKTTADTNANTYYSNYKSAKRREAEEKKDD